jgi:NADH dehydrogenase FAD-containing subunit
MNLKKKGSNKIFMTMWKNDVKKYSNLVVKLGIQDMNYMKNGQHKFIPFFKKCNVVQFVELWNSLIKKFTKQDKNNYNNTSNKQNGCTS